MKEYGKGYVKETKKMEEGGRKEREGIKTVREEGQCRQSVMQRRIDEVRGFLRPHSCQAMIWQVFSTVIDQLLLLSGRERVSRS